MNSHTKLLRMVFMGMMIALGVVISPILRVEGMCPMAHLINITCAVMLGPLEAFICAFLIGIIRMALMGIPPLALTGAIFGAALSGILYRASKGKIAVACLGEIIGTGIIGAIASYPVMSILWEKEGLSWLFYVPSFICGTLIGGSIAYLFLKKIASNGILAQIQSKRGSRVYNDKGSILSDALSIAALGGILFVVIEIAAVIFSLEAPLWDILAYAAPAVSVAAGLAYYLIKKVKHHEKTS